MNRIYRFLISICALIIFYTTTLSAQDRIRVEAPNIVATDEQFNVTFVIEGENKASDFQWEPGADFRLVWGPQRGSSTSISIINGKRSKTSQSTFTYVLFPLKKGKLTLSPAKAKVKGRQIVSDTFDIEVLDADSSTSTSGNNVNSSQGAGQSQSRNLNSGRSDATGQISDKNLFLKLSLNRTNVVVGEPITATLKLYQNGVSCVGFESGKFPVFNGFWSQELDSPSEIRFSREKYGNKIYDAALLKSFVIIPQQSGELEIDPSEFICVVDVRREISSSASIFDSFFQDDYTRIRKRVYTPKMKVKVAPLPSGAPASFSGGVGKFTINAKISKDSLKTHDAASLIITVKGTGNVSLLNAPEVKFPADFESYDVKTTQKADKSGTRGSKIFEIPFIPRSAGDFVIEPIEYGYYDVTSKKYQVIQTEPLNIHVVQGSRTVAVPEAGVPMVEQSGVANVGSDIRFIKTEMPKLSTKGKFFYGSGTYKILLLFILVASIIVVTVMRKYRELRSDVVGMKNRKATKMAKKRLTIAGKLLKENNYSEFYAELHKALLGYISDKLNMVAEEMSKDNIESELVLRNVSKDVAEEFTSLLDACEFARYSPDPGLNAMQEHYEASIEAISRVDSMIKTRSHSSGRMLSLVLTILMFGGSFIFSTTANAQSEETYPQKLWSNAVEAYAQGKWKESIEDFENIVSIGLESPDLYYNLGNAYFKEGEISRAILNYERTLKLDPSYKDARYNLEVANLLIKDRIDEIPDFILKAWTKSLCYKLDSDAWGVISIIFFAILAIMLLIFVLSAQSSWRRLGFYSSIVVLALFVCATSFASWQKQDYMKDNAAIMMRPVSSIKSAPSVESAKDLFILHEGTKVFLLDTVGEWNNIQLADGRQGWVRSNELEKI